MEFSDRSGSKPEGDFRPGSCVGVTSSPLLLGPCHDPSAAARKKRGPPVGMTAFFDWEDRLAAGMTVSRNAAERGAARTRIRENYLPVAVEVLAIGA